MCHLVPVLTGKFCPYIMQIHASGFNDHKIPQGTNGRWFLFMWRSFAFEGPASPQCGCVFLVFNAFGVGFVGLESQKKKKKKK